MSAMMGMPGIQCFNQLASEALPQPAAMASNLWFNRLPEPSTRLLRECTVFFKFVRLIISSYVQYQYVLEWIDKDSHWWWWGMVSLDGYVVWYTLTRSLILIAFEVGNWYLIVASLLQSMYKAPKSWNPSSTSSVEE
jgi:hypothetical protein